LSLDIELFRANNAGVLNGDWSSKDVRCGEIERSPAAMLPKELSILSRALKTGHFYTFSGDARMRQELEDVDLLLEHIRQAEDLSEVQAAVDRLIAKQPSPDQFEMRL
jgi:hypothetical protein